MALAREIGDDYRAARADGNLGTLALYALDYDEAIARLGASTAYMREIDDAARAEPDAPEPRHRP